MTGSGGSGDFPWLPGPETQRLLAEAMRTVQDLAGSVGPQDTGAAAADGRDAGPGHTGPECRICPLCRMAAALRQVRPEVLAHLLAAGEELLAAVREFTGPPPAGEPGASAAGGAASGSGYSGDGGEPGGGEPWITVPRPAPSRPGVQPIEITD